MGRIFRTEYFNGLSEEQVRLKLDKDGFNELPSSKPKGIIQIALGVVKEPMFLLLVACGTLYLILGDVQEGLMLLGFVFVIMGIEFYQENKTEKALDALKDLASPRALVIREGIEKRIPSKEVVTDDIVVLQEGDRVPADALVLSCTNLLADESLLTGESVPVRKRETKDGDSGFTPGGDDIHCVYSGSMIVQGNGIVKVTATGMRTEIGKIGKALESVKEEKNVMARPPKDINEPFFGSKKILLSCTQGIGILVMTLLVYFIGLKTGYTEKAVRTLTFVTLISSNIAIIISNRSWTSNFIKIILTPNITVKWVIGGAILFMILIPNIPFLLNLFQFERIGLLEAVICIIVGLLSITWFELYKHFKLVRKPLY